MHVLLVPSCLPSCSGHPAVSQGPKTPGKDWPVRPGVGHSIGLDEHSIEIKQD